MGKYWPNLQEIFRVYDVNSSSYQSTVKVKKMEGKAEENWDSD